MKSNNRFSILSAPIFATIQLSSISYSSLILSGYGTVQPFLNLNRTFHILYNDVVSLYHNRLPITTSLKKLNEHFTIESRNRS